MEATTAGTIIFAITCIVLVMAVGSAISYARQCGRLESERHSLAVQCEKLKNELSYSKNECRCTERENEKLKNEVETYKNNNQDFFDALIRLGCKSE